MRPHCISPYKIGLFSWFQNDDQESLELTNDDNGEPLLLASSRSKETQQGGSFEEDYRAVFTALTQRHDKHQTSIDLDELIKDGRAIYHQCQQQARALQRQKKLVDMMSRELESMSENV